MINRVDHIIIGKDIARTLALTLGSNSANSNLADGEVVLLDKNKALLPAGATKQDYPEIHVAVGLTSTFYNPGQTTYTKRVMKVSPLITNPVSYKGTSYTAPVQREWTIGYPAASLSANDEVALRAVYTDPHMTNQTSGQFVQEWRKKVVGTYGTTFVREIAALVNNDLDARITAATITGGTGLRLTAKALENQTINDLDEHYMIDFEPFLYESNATTGVATTIATIRKTNSVAITYGYGTWQQIRDYERWTKSNDGVRNIQGWPQATGHTDFRTVKDETYDQITIVYNKPFVSADNHYIKDTKETLVIALPDGASQTTEVVDALNTWMESWGFPYITL